MNSPRMIFELLFVSAFVGISESGSIARDYNPIPVNTARSGWDTVPTNFSYPKNDADKVMYLDEGMEASIFVANIEWDFMKHDGVENLVVRMTANATLRNDLWWFALLFSSDDGSVYDFIEFSIKLIAGNNTHCLLMFASDQFLDEDSVDNYDFDTHIEYGFTPDYAEAGGETNVDLISCYYSGGQYGVVFARPVPASDSFDISLKGKYSVDAMVFEWYSYSTYEYFWGSINWDTPFSFSKRFFPEQLLLITVAGCIYGSIY